MNFWRRNRNAKKPKRPRLSEPLQTARFGYDGGRTPRFELTQVAAKQLPTHFDSFPGAVRYLLVTNEDAELISLADFTKDAVQVKADAISSSSDFTKLPERWYCIEHLRASGKQLVFYVTFSDPRATSTGIAGEELAKFKEAFEAYLDYCFPDNNDPEFHRTIRNMGMK